MYTLFDKDKDEPMHFNDGLRRIHPDDVVSVVVTVVTAVVVLYISIVALCTSMLINACTQLSLDWHMHKQRVLAKRCHACLHCARYEVCINAQYAAAATVVSHNCAQICACCTHNWLSAILATGIRQA